MYLNYFGMVERPFSIAPDPQYLYMSTRHREAMAHLSYGLSQGGCFIVLTGEVGTGKTTLCRNLMSDLPDNVDVALVLNATINERELLETVCDELQIDYSASSSQKQLLDSINQHLLKTYADNRHTVLIIDEAQILSRDVLEQVRLLTNLETTKAKLLQIILIGQPELGDVLARNDLRQLSQRVTARYHLPSIQRNEIEEYVNFRLGVAGCKKPLFSKPALKQLHSLTGGIPRKINVLADHCLLATYSKSELLVDSKTVKQAAKDVFIRSESENQIRKQPWWVLATAIVLLNIALWWFLVGDSTRHEQPSQRITGPEAAESAVANAEVITEGKPAIASISPPQADSLLPADTDESLPSSDEGGQTKVDLSDRLQQATTRGGEANLTTILRPEDVQPGRVVVSDEYLDDTLLADALSVDSLGAGVVTPAAKPRPSYLANTQFAKVLEASADQTGRIQTLKNLAQAWDVQLPSPLIRSACEELSDNGVECLKMSSWLSLQRFNRPVIMELAHQDQFHHVILFKLDGEQAQVLVGEQSHSLPITELRDRWINSGTIFWRPGEAGSELLMNGDVAATLPTVRMQLNRTLSLQGLPLLGNTDSPAFDSDLAVKVRELQSRFGILADGKVGNETYLLINELLKPDVTPTLVVREPRQL